MLVLVLMVHMMVFKSGREREAPLQMMSVTEM